MFGIVGLIVLLAVGPNVLALQRHEGLIAQPIYLGIVGALVAAAIVGAFLLGVRCFQRAGDALDLVLGGNRFAWFRVCLWLGLALCGAGGASYGLMYFLRYGVLSE